MPTQDSRGETGASSADLDIQAVNTLIQNLGTLTEMFISIGKSEAALVLFSRLAMFAQGSFLPGGDAAYDSKALAALLNVSEKSAYYRASGQRSKSMWKAADILQGGGNEAE